MAVPTYLSNNETATVKLNWSSTNNSTIYIISSTLQVFCASGIVTEQHNEIFETSNKSILLSVLYNQGYDISVTASNCAGNSTPAEIIVRIGIVRF